MNRTLNILFVLFSALYIGLDNFEQLPFFTLLKIIPIAILFYAVVSTPAFQGKILLAIALIFSASGDVLLSGDTFVLGIAAFLLAQLNYATHFARNWQGIKTRAPLSLVLCGFFLFMAWLLTPHLGELRIPVFAYLIVIGFMGLMAIQSTYPLRWAVLGALVFICSDSLIAINKFVRPLPASGEAIMFTYYAAQWMIIVGSLASIKKSSAE